MAGSLGHYWFVLKVVVPFGRGHGEAEAQISGMVEPDIGRGILLRREIIVKDLSPLDEGIVERSEGVGRDQVNREGEARNGPAGRRWVSWFVSRPSRPPAFVPTSLRNSNNTQLHGSNKSISNR
jgi:hypothetical protein